MSQQGEWSIADVIIVSVGTMAVGIFIGCAVGIPIGRQMSRVTITCEARKCPAETKPTVKDGDCLCVGVPQ